MSFTPDFNVASLASEYPSLPPAHYAADIVNVTTSSKDKSFFNIAPRRAWVNGQAEDVLDDYNQKIYQLEGSLLINLKLISEQAKEILQRDEPGMTSFLPITFEENFTPDGTTTGWHPSKTRNPRLKDFMKLLGLDTVNFHELISYEPREFDIPDELAHMSTEAAQALLNSREYYYEYFTQVANYAKNNRVKAFIGRRTAKNGRKENFVDNSGDSCGLIAYKQGDELDTKK